MIITDNELYNHLLVEIERATDEQQIEQLRHMINNLEEGDNIMVRYRNQFKQDKPKPDVTTGKVVDITLEELPEDTAELFTKEELQAKYKDELKGLCELLEVSAEGTKSDLIERIIGTFSKE